MYSTIQAGASNGQSWGINNFTVYIQPCPAGCVVCSGPNATQCSMWETIETDWIENVPTASDSWDVTGPQPE